jgi:aminoglycoside phosphotransferase (APT) family kinase protein
VLGSGGHRAGWDDLPDAVVRAVADVLGAPVVRAESQPGGFSPGTADRVVTAAGDRAFVKAVSPELNPDSVELHRAEVRVAAQLPRGLPVPRLLGHVEVAGWVVLVFDDVAGRHPHLPWTHADLTAVLDGLQQLADDATPCPVTDLPTAADRLDGLFRGADRMAADGVVVPFLSELQALSRRALGCLDGDTLVHSDLRADNVLLTPGGAVFVDWPWACRGPAWLDTLLLLMEVQRLGGHDVDALLATSPVIASADPDDLTAVLAGAAGYFLDAARRPAPPGLPTVRAFQRVQGEALMAWLAPRLRST